MIKERIRATYHRLPYKRLPRLMLKILVADAAKKLNFFPSKHGISKYYSPRMILHQRNLDYTKHCRFAFGTYVQGHDEPHPTNTTAARTLDCIYLRYNDNFQGGHELLHLPTNRMITCRHVTQLPITPAIINQVHAIADSENVPEGLKITNRTGQVLYDSAWIAGVDYTDESVTEMDDDNEYETEHNNESHDGIPTNEMDDIDEIDEMHPDEIEGLANKHNHQDDEDPYPTTITDEESDEESDEDSEDDPDTSDPDPEDQGTTSTVPTTNPAGLRVTRAGRIIKPPLKLSLQQCHLQTQACQPIEYTYNNAKVITTIIATMNMGISTKKTKKGHQFTQTYGLTKGIKKFGTKGREAAYEEMNQLHNRTVFKPTRVEEMTQMERHRAMESIIFLVEKKDGRIKAQTCANGSTQREYIDRDEAASPTAMTDSILLTSTIEAKQGRDIMTADIPNAFVQTEIDQKDNEERIMLKIRGILVDMLVEISPETYQDYVINENGSKVLYLTVLKALYGMLKASMLYYKKFRTDIESIGFILNPYDPCVANRMVDGKQHTITWHVDDLKSSHINKKVNDEFFEWLKKTYASDNIGQIKATRGKRHDYLGMILDFSESGVLKVDMTTYIKNMISEFPEKLTKKNCPWNENLFKIDNTAKKLDNQKKQVFHTFVMKGMFLCKRARQDIQTGIAFLSTRVRDPNEGDWLKLVRIMNFLNATTEETVRLIADDTQAITWYIDSAFAVHNDYKSQTGGGITLGGGFISSSSIKQKINTRSSTEAELVAVDDLVSKGHMD